MKLTTAPDKKFVPVTVRVNAALPAIALVCDRDEMAAAGLLTVKIIGGDVPPPGMGFVTVTGNIPAVAMSPDPIAAVS